MAHRWKRGYRRVDQWARANPGNWSAAVGVLMFLIGWLADAHIGLGIMAGLIWGGAFFTLTAVRRCPGPREMLDGRRARAR